MRILILADRGSRNYEGADLIVNVTKSAALARHEVDCVVLSCDELRHCRGCFDCWVKTPGRCIQAGDQGNAIIGKVINADLVLLLSRVTYGGFSADVKVLLDRSIPLLSPFFKTIDGQMHHQRRYDRYPYLVAFGYGDFTEGEFKTFGDLLERNAINYYAPNYLALPLHDAGAVPQALNGLADFLKAVEQ